MQEELKWVKQSQKARQSKSKARINAYDRMAEEANRLEQIESGAITIPPGPQLGDGIAQNSKSIIFWGGEIDRLRRVIEL